MAQHLVRQNTAIQWSAPPQLSSTLEAKIKLGQSLREVQLPDADEVKQLPALIVAHDRALVGASAEQIVSFLGAYAMAWPDDKKRSDAEAAGRLRIYVKGLEDIPPDVLEIAFDEAVKSCTFFPTVKELRDLADDELRQRRYKRFVMQRMIEKYEEAEAARKREAELMPPEVAREKLAKLAERLGTRFPSQRTATG
jgi:hypothetical protein